MNQQDQPSSERQLAEYLDGLMGDAERERFEELLPNHPELLEQLEAQARIDASLRRQFDFQPPSEERVKALMRSAESRRAEESVIQPVPQFGTAARSGRRLALLAVAAGMAWAFVAWHFWDRKPDSPRFTSRPLVDIYRETISMGFEPYYECHDDQRFAATFLQRQGQPLQLAKMPDGIAMLGLSYSGGLSRHTTAMLCRVDAKPVMVFVDTVAADVAKNANGNGEVHVFRESRHGLVFYEVTPFPQARVIDFLRSPSATDSQQ